MKAKRISNRSLVLGITFILIAAIIITGAVFFKSKISSLISSSASTNYPYQVSYSNQTSFTNDQQNDITNKHINVVYTAIRERIHHLDQQPSLSKIQIISNEEINNIRKDEGTYIPGYTAGGLYTPPSTISFNADIFSGSLDESHVVIGHELLHGYIKGRATRLTNLVEEGMVQVTTIDHLNYGAYEYTYPAAVAATRALLATLKELGNSNPDDTLQEIMFEEGIEPGLRKRLDEYLPENKKKDGAFAYLNSLYNDGNYNTAINWLESVKAAISPMPSGTSASGTATPGGTAGAGNESFGETLEVYIANFYTWAIGIAGLLAIIMIIYAGYQYVSSAGNPDQINQAKDIVIGAVAALVLIIIASLFLRTLGVSV